MDDESGESMEPMNIGTPTYRVADIIHTGAYAY